MIETRVGGTVDSRFEPVREAFAANFERFDEVGAAVCVYVEDRKVIDLWGGTTARDGSDPYSADTLQLVWSCTKGITAIAAHILAQEGRLDFDAPVVRYWPEFGAAGKDEIPVRWLFSHKAGLAALERPIVLDDVLRWTPAVEALAAQKPLWEPGSAHGYHTYTFGWLAGEVIRRITGTTVGRFVADRITSPLGAEFWIGLPETENARVAPVIPASPPAPGAEPDPLLRRAMDPTRSRFGRSRRSRPPSSTCIRSVPLSCRPATGSAPPALSLGSTRPASARSTACASSTQTRIAGATITQAHGEDLVLVYETRYGIGFQLPHPFRPMAGEGSFGHYGSGGSVGFANPGLGLSFGYVMNRMGPVYGADPRTRNLVDALLGSL